MENEMCCWWCCHKIPNNIYLNMPYNYNKYKNEYTTYGKFCSWECMKGYCMNENDYNKNHRLTLISMMYYDVNKYNRLIVPAPPRQCLKMFGGDMTIEEFRKNNEVIVMNMPPLIKIEQTFDKMPSKNYKFIDKEEANTQFKNMNTKVKINPMKIKSSKGNSSNNKNQSKSLATILGISEDCT